MRWFSGMLLDACVGFLGCSWMHALVFWDAMMITKDSSSMRCDVLVFWDAMIFCRGTCNYKMRDVDLESILVYTLQCIASIDHFLVACYPEDSFVTTLQDDYKR
jgi:hypothetical protein